MSSCPSVRYFVEREAAIHNKSIYLHHGASWCLAGRKHSSSPHSIAKPNQGLEPELQLPKHRCRALVRFIELGTPWREIIAKYKWLLTSNRSPLFIKYLFLGRLNLLCPNCSSWGSFLSPRFPESSWRLLSRIRRNHSEASQSLPDRAHMKILRQ